MPKSSTKRLLLIDGTSLAFRAYYAMYNQLDRMVTSKGLHTNALVAFNNFIDKIVEPYDPDYALVAFDAGGGSSTFRAKEFEDYKGDRGSAPEELVEQFPYFEKMIEAHGIAVEKMAGFEADDIIGTLAKQAEEKGIKTTIVTGDRDLTQLATSMTTVDITVKGVTEIESYTPAHLQEKLGIEPRQIIEMKALTGDTSDNYPGVTKVGEKTALKLLDEYDNIDNLYENIDSFKESKLKENLINDQAIARRAKVLATIRTDAPVESTFDNLSYKGVNVELLEKLYQEIEFKAQLVKLHALVNSGQIKTTDNYANQSAKPENKINYIELTENNIDNLRDIKDEVAIYLEVANGNYHFDEIYGFAIGNQQVGYYATRDLNLLKNEILQEILNSEIKKLVFDGKALINSLNRFDLKINSIDFDFLLVAYLLDTVDNNNQLPALATKYDIFLSDDEEIYGKGAKFRIPANDEVFFEHLANKTQAIFNLKNKTEKLIADQELDSLYRTIELPLSQVLAQMEIDGIKVDQTTLSTIGSDLLDRIDIIQQDIFEQAGTEFNINSPKQLGELLFEKLKLPVIKKTKTGYSTDASVLEELAPQAPIVEQILEYRTLTKLQSTYIVGLSEQIATDQKIHTTFLQTLTQTGRLASIDPNLQNIPVRIEEGRRIRKAFVPSNENWLIFGADYSQIELRVLAHITQDKNLIEAFQNDEDIHAATARSIFSLGKNDTIDSEQRRKAKAVNFGIVYGISDYGLSQNLKITRKEAREMIDIYFSQFSGVQKWIDDIKSSAHQLGYVQTLAGRRRYLPDIHSRNFNLKNFAERTAMNSPIQGSAADIIKIAMINIQNELEKSGLKSKMLIQVHDELIFETPKEELEILQEMIPKIMDSAFDLKVPLKVDSHFGDTWYDAK